MKRVLLLIKGLGRGGAEQLLASAAAHTDRGRFDYEVAYLLPWKDALVKELRDEGIAVSCLEGAGDPGWTARLRRLVRRRRIDLIHAHSPVAAIGARVGLTGLSVRHALPAQSCAKVPANQGTIRWGVRRIRAVAADSV